LNHRSLALGLLTRFDIQYYQESLSPDGK